MAWGQARKFLNGIFSRDDNEATLSRRDMLAGLGLAALFVAAPGVAEARTDAPAVAPETGAPDAAKAVEPDADERNAADGADELSAQRYWRRRYWRRRYWGGPYGYRRRYWRRRYWRRRYWRRRYWRGPYLYRRRYWRRYW